MALFLSAKLKKLNFDHYKEEKLLYRMNQKQQKPVP